MSYGIAIWYSKKPITEAEAFSVYEKICHDENVTLNKHSNLNLFLEELKKKFPDPSGLNDDELYNSIWSSNIEYERNFIYLNISSRAGFKEIKSILDLALNMDLVCCDGDHFYSS